MMCFCRCVVVVCFLAGVGLLLLFAFVCVVFGGLVCCCSFFVVVVCVFVNRLCRL